MAIPSSLLTAQEAAELAAGALLADAQAARLVTLRVTVIARLVRQALPTARHLVVDTGSWDADEHGAGSVHLLGVLDDQQTQVWTDEHPTNPAVDDQPGGWTALCAEVEQQLLAALDHVTPEENGWIDLRDAALDLGHLSVPATDAQIVVLPDAGRMPQDRTDVASMQDRLQPLVRPLGLVLSPLPNNA